MTPPSTSTTPPPPSALRRLRLVATGLNHRTAPLALRERFAVDDESLPRALALLVSRPGVHEAVVLSTCNRVEIYTAEEEHARGGSEASGAAGEAGGSASFFADFFGIAPSAYIDHLYRLHDEKSARHLFTVASGLDSMLIGEPQIIGQVRSAYAQARAAATAGPLLSALFERALAAGKRVRTETGVQRLGLSVPWAAGELVRRALKAEADAFAGEEEHYAALQAWDKASGVELGNQIPPPRPVTAALLGRGQMCAATAAPLRDAGVTRLVAVARQLDDAVEFARPLGAEPRQYTPDLAWLADVDVLVVGTRAISGPLVARDALASLIEADAAPDSPAPQSSHSAPRRRLLIDLSVPREVEPACATLSGVTLRNIDNLEALIADNRRIREEEGRKAAVLLEYEVAAFAKWYAAQEVVPTICAFRERLEHLRAEEIRRAFGDYEGWNPELREKVENFSRTLMTKLAHTPTVRLKAHAAAGCGSAEQHQAALRHLFALEEAVEK